MEAKLIKTEEEYNSALARIDELFDSVPGSKEFDEVELFMTLVELYEEKHYKIEVPDPIEAIKYRMEQMGYTQTDLAKFVGLKSRASEILNKKRKLTLEMIRTLHDSLKIPTEVLIQPYK